MLPISSVASTNFQCQCGCVEATAENWQLAILVMATLSHWQHYKKKTKRRHKLNTKRCAAEDVLLRTFCSFPAQGLGGWCAGAMGNVANITLSSFRPTQSKFKK